MASAIDDRPLRIVCTKCVRIVRVLFQSSVQALDGMFVATECCERRFGLITGYAFQLQKRGRDLTVDDIRIDDDIEEFAKREDEYAEHAVALAKWARWSIVDCNATAVPNRGVGPR